MSSRDRDRRDPPRRESIYNEWYATHERRQSVRVADTNPVTGELEWAPDWPRLATGWQPLEEFMRDRGAM